MGKILIAAGIALIAVGLLIQTGARFDWFGRLPGDIFIRKGRSFFFFPITTSILASIVVSVIMWLFFRR